MMKFRLRCTFSLMLGCMGLFAQKGDYNWLCGFGSSSVPNTGGGVYFGNAKMDFNESPVKIAYDSIAMNFERTNTSYSDSN